MPKERGFSVWLSGAKYRVIVDRYCKQNDCGPAEAVKRLISLGNWLVRSERGGCEIFIKYPNGEIQRLVTADD